MNKKLLLCLLALVMGSVTAIAQQKSKFSIISFGLNQFDATATMPQYEKFDTNNARYAIIKVTSTNPDDDLRGYNFDFANCKAIPVPQKDGSLWVYVQRMARTVTITREGYVPMRHHDLGETIEAGRVYDMVFSSSGPIVRYQMVQFKVAPSDSKATILYTRVGSDAPEARFGELDATGCASRSLEYGKYTYRVVSDNYRQSVGTFTLNSRELKVEDVVLVPNFAKVTFKVDADADIFINGERRGHREWSGNLNDGRYTVECRQANHRNSSQYVKVDVGRDTIITLPAPQPILGTLAVSSNPSGASIVIDGKDYGVAPKNIDIIIGRHKVVLSKTDYAAATDSVEIKENRTTMLSLALDRKAMINIASTPDSAELFIDGERVGFTPYKAEMALGEHQLRLSADGYKSISELVRFDAASPNLSYKLSRMLIKDKAFYVELFGQAGMSNGFGVNVGGYVSKFNIEASFTKYFVTDGVYYCDHGTLPDGSYTDSGKPVYVKLNALSFGVKLGYGITMGSRARLTPRLGLNLLNISNDYSELPTTSHMCLSVGARFEFAFSSHIGVSLTPEYQMSMNSTDVSDALKNVSSDVKNLLSGFNAKVGIFYNF